MKSIRIGLATIALLLTTAFVLAACSAPAPEQQTTTEAPAQQTQQASTSQQTTSPSAAAAPTATLPPANTPKPASNGDARSFKACPDCRTAGRGPRQHRHSCNRQRANRAGDSRHRKLD